MILSADGNECNFSPPVVVHGKTIRASADGKLIQIGTPAGWRELRQVPDKYGKNYLRVWITPKKSEAVHKLVALAWHGPAPTPAHRLVEHIDGSRRNNHKGNVRWATFSDNLNSAFQLREREAKYPVKLGEALVYEIRTRRHRAEIATLADELGTGEQTIRDVFDGITWRRVRADQPRLPGTY